MDLIALVSVALMCLFVTVTAKGYFGLWVKLPTVCYLSNHFKVKASLVKCMAHAQGHSKQNCQIGRHSM